MRLIQFFLKLYLLIESVITEKILILINGTFLIARKIKYLSGYRINILFEKKVTRNSVKRINEIISIERLRKYFNERNLRFIFDKFS